MFTLDPARLKDILQQLHQATLDHTTWHDDLLGSLLCHAPDGPALAGPEGPRDCRFGHWYRDSAPGELRRQPAFRAIGVEHRHLHQLAERLVETVGRGEPVGRDDYRDFTETEARLRLELDALSHEVQAALRNRDPVTGAYEREVLLPELREWRELARRGVQESCLAFLDLDHFKGVNDRHGHLLGDRVLACAAARIAEQLRPYDKLFRYGGDEFVVLLPGADLEAGRGVAERVRRRLAATPLAVGADGAAVCLTASFGLAGLDPAIEAEESVDRADTALLIAKSSGRNRVVAWDPSVMTQRAFRALDPALAGD